MQRAGAAAEERLRLLATELGAAYEPAPSKNCPAYDCLINGLRVQCKYRSYTKRGYAKMCNTRRIGMQSQGYPVNSFDVLVVFSNPDKNFGWDGGTFIVPASALRVTRAGDAYAGTIVFEELKPFRNQTQYLVNADHTPPNRQLAFEWP